LNRIPELLGEIERLPAVLCGRCYPAGGGRSVTTRCLSNTLRVAGSMSDTAGE